METFFIPKVSRRIFHLIIYKHLKINYQKRKHFKHKKFPSLQFNPIILLIEYRIFHKKVLILVHKN